jgi:hypothetical protein
MTPEKTQARPQPGPTPPARRASRRPAIPRVSLELVGYVLLAVGLAVLLWSQLRNVDGFFLDEWIYVHGSQYIWENLPGGVVETIPGWTRGPQRLYSTLLAFTWGPFSAPTAFTLSHIVNVMLLVSAIAPAALLARRVIDRPLYRILAVALGVAVPWLAIGAHQLTENLAFPLFLWAAYATVRTAEDPTPARQVIALAAIGALVLCRLNLGFVLIAFLLAVVAGELRRRRSERQEPLADWLRRAARREAIVIVAIVFALALALSGAVNLGAYGGVDLDTALERLFGDGAPETRRTMLTYTGALVVGGFVFPFAIGLGVALAGVAGRAGRRLFIPSLVALASLIAVVVAVSVFTVGAALEERYVFYVYTPLAILAVAGVEQAHRLRGWLAAGGALALWPLVAGYAPPASDSDHFFAAPAGAFWSRVVHNRLVGWEEDLFGWMFIGPTGWLLVLVGLLVMLIVLGALRERPRLSAGLLYGGLAICAVAQVASLHYVMRQELYGTKEAPGGIALSDDRAADRETWLDERIPDGEAAAMIPGVQSPGARWGGAERLSFWNKAIDATVRLPWNGTVAPVPPGNGVVDTQVGPDQLAEWSPEPEWVAAYRDDPRVQFPGRLVARSPVSPYALYKTTASAEQAFWTSVGLGSDGAVLAREPVTMTLDPSRAGAARTVTLTLASADGATGGVRWRLAREGGSPTAGRLRPGQTDSVRLAVPACASGEECPPVSWKLTGTGPAVGLPVPDFGAPGPPRPVILKVLSARIR